MGNRGVEVGLSAMQETHNRRCVRRGRHRGARGTDRLTVTQGKYEICLKIITGELARREAVAQAKVDRSTIVALRETAKDVAIAAFQALWPGRRRDARGGRRAGSTAGGGPVVLHVIVISPPLCG
jgi:hypothetical protein